MNIFRFATRLLAPLVCVAITGCHSQPAGPGAEKAALYEEDKGICLPEDMRKEFGVETAEVIEKPLRRHLTKTARIFRAANAGEPAGASVLVSVEEAGELKVGQPVCLHRTSGDKSECIGAVTRLDEHARAVLGQIEVLVDLPDPERCIPVGTFLPAIFVIRELKPVVVVPESALLRAADGTFVYAVHAPYLTRKRVKAGAMSDGFVEVEGLHAGDFVAVRGVDNLRLVELKALKGGTPCCPVP